MPKNNDITDTRVTQALWHEIGHVLNSEKHTKQSTRVVVKYPIHIVISLLVLLQVLSVVFCVAWFEYRLSQTYASQKERPTFYRFSLLKEGKYDVTANS